MGRHKKNWKKEETFDDVFGSFDAEGVDNKPMFQIVQLDESTVKPCKRCGRYPRIHLANFKNKEKYPNSVYIDCKCGCCDGEWHGSKDDAIEKWNEDNKFGRPRDPNVKDSVDFIEEIMENVKI